MSKYNAYLISMQVYEILLKMINGILTLRSKYCTDFTYKWISRNVYDAMLHV